MLDKQAAAQLCECTSISYSNLPGKWVLLRHPSMRGRKGKGDIGITQCAAQLAAARGGNDDVLAAMYFIHHGGA